MVPSPKIIWDAFISWGGGLFIPTNERISRSFLSLIFLGMSTRNFYPYKWIKDALGDDFIMRATKIEKWGVAYVFGPSLDSGIALRTNNRHTIVHLSKLWHPDPHLYRSLQIHKARGGKVDWTLALKDVLL